MKSLPFVSRFLFAILPALFALTTPAFAVQPIASGAKVYIQPADGFGSHLAAAFREKGVPLVVVSERVIADYEVVGHSDTQKAGWAKIVFLKTGSREEANISVVDVRTNDVVFARTYDTGNTFRGRQSAAESCARQIDEAIRKGGRLASSLPALSEAQIAAARAREHGLDRPALLTVQPEPVREAEEPKRMVVRFTSTPASAEVHIDGEYWGTTPTVGLTRLPVGPHTILVKKPGYQPWECKITLAADDDRTISAELQAVVNDGTRPRVIGAN